MTYHEKGGLRPTELISIGDLKPHDRNPRTHSKEQLKKLEQSIRHFGFTNPLLSTGRTGSWPATAGLLRRNGSE